MSTMFDLRSIAMRYILIALIAFYNLVCYCWCFLVVIFYPYAWFESLGQWILVFVSPLFEEIFKFHFGPYCFAVIEYFMYITDPKYAHHGIYLYFIRLLPFCMHILTSYLSFREALLFHIFWNFLALHNHEAFSYPIYGSICRHSYIPKKNVTDDHMGGDFNVWNPMVRPLEPFSSPHHMAFIDVTKSLPDVLVVTIFSYLGAVSPCYCTPSGRVSCDRNLDTFECYVCFQASVFAQHYYTSLDILTLAAVMKAVRSRRYMFTLSWCEIMDEAVRVDSRYVEQGKMSRIEDLKSSAMQNQDSGEDYLRDLISRTGGHLDDLNEEPEFLTSAQVAAMSSLNAAAAEFVPKRRVPLVERPKFSVTSILEVQNLLRTARTKEDLEIFKETALSVGRFPDYLVMRAYRECVHALERGDVLPEHQEHTIAADVRRFSRMPDIEHKGRKFSPLKISGPFQPDIRNHKSLRSNNFWKVPIVKAMAAATIPPRPTVHNWTPASGKAWLMIWGAHLFQPNRRRNYAVIGNESAKFLFQLQTDVLNPIVLAAALQDAHLWWSDMNSPTERVFEAPLLGDFMTVEQKKRLNPKREIRVLGTSISSIADLDSFAPFFKRHQPLFKVCRAYLEGQTVDEIKMRTMLNRYLSGSIVKQGLFDDFLKEVPAADDFISMLSAIMGHPGFLEIPVEVTRIVTLLLALSQQTTLLGVVACMAQWGAGHPWFQELIKKLVVYENQASETHGFFDWKIGDLLKTRSGSLVFDAVLAGGALLLGSQFFGTDPSLSTNWADSIWHLSSRMRVDASKSVAERVFLIFGKFCELCSDCIKTCSFKPLLSPRYDPAAWRLECEAAITYSFELVANATGVQSNSKRIKELRDKKLIPDYWVEQITFSEFKDLVDDLYLRGVKISASYSGQSVHRDIENTITKLRAFQAAFSNGYSVMAIRIAPLGIMFYGPAGAGKTNLANDVARSIGRYKGYTIDPTAFYDWQPNNNFQDGLGPSHWVIKADDIDQDPSPAVRGTPNHVGIVIDVVNNKPMPVEQSDVALKGKICARPLLFLMMSNYPVGRLEKYSLCPAAFWRRLPIRIGVRAKDKYARSTGSGVLDPAKAENCLDGELFDLEISYYGPQFADLGQPFNVAPFSAPVPITRCNLLKLLCARFDEHLKQQQDVISRSETGSNYCPECYSDLSVDGFGCPCSVSAIVPQGGYVAAAVTVLAAAVAVKIVGQTSRTVGLSAVNATADIRQLVAESRHLVGDITAEIRRIQSIRDSYREAVVRANRFVPLAGKLVALGLAMKFIHFVYKWSVSVRDQGRENNSTGLTPFEWKRAQQDFVPGLPSNGVTYTKEELLIQLQQCFVQVRGSRIVHGLIVAHNLILTVYHAVKDDGEATIVQDSVHMKVLLSPVTRVRIPGRDLALVKVGHLVGVPSILKKMWYDRDVSLSQFDELEIVGPKGVTYVSTVNRFSMLPTEGLVLSCDCPTIEGDCGMVYIGRFNSGWRIVAMHSGAMVGFLIQPTAIGQILTSLEVTRFANSIAVVPQGVEIPLSQTCMEPLKQVYTHYPKKSEFWSAVSHFGVQGKPIGSVEFHVHGSTMKTKVHPTIYADDFRDLETLWCGRPHYWVAPTFRGEMIDGKWVSSYTRSLTYLDRGSRDEPYFWLALIDYLSPMRFLDCEGFRPLSENEVFVGVPGTVIGAVDRTTSMGMPFNRKKSNYMGVVNGETYVHERFWEAFDEFELALRSGVIPAPVVLGTGKDEQLKFTKVETHDERIFSCLPASFNCVSKVQSGPIKAFMRANMLVFECMVGINMTSKDSNQIIQMMRSTDPSLSRILEKDIVKLDKSYDGVMFDFSALILYYVSWLLGLNPIRSYQTVHGLRNAVWVYKNDFFQMGAMNSSGNDLTVEINSFEGSIHERVLYYKMKYPDGLPPYMMEAVVEVCRNFLNDPACVGRVQVPLTFRDDCGLAVYGDDSLNAVSQRCKFYQPDSIVSIGRGFGIQYTDGQKADDIKWRTLAEVTFLKRNFVWDPDLGLYVAPIGLKTLAKMLVLSKGSTLSDRDHCATLLTDVMREAVYHGEQFYVMMASRVAQVAVKYGLEHNGYYYVPDYSVYRAMMKEGSFQTWSVSREPSVPVVEGALIQQGGPGALMPGKNVNEKMSNSSGIDLKPSVAVVEPVHEAKTEVKFEIGAIEESSEVVVDGYFKPSQFTQKMPVTELGRFMERLVGINIYTMASTDAALTAVQTSDPWSLYLANAAVADKVANFAYIRGTIELEFLVACPAGSYGLYIVSAVPDGYPVPAETYSLVGATQTYETVLQCPNVRIDVSSATNGRLSLPFIWPYDWAALPTGPNQMWTVNIWCLQPISSASSDTTLTGTIKTLARIMDCELVVPTDQGKKFLEDKRDSINSKVKSMTGGKKASEMASTVAGLAAKASLVPMLAPFAGPLATGAAAASQMLDWFGFTRTTAEATPTPVVKRPFSNIANMDVDDTSEVAAMSVANSISYDPAISGLDHMDPAAFEAIFEKWTLITTASWAMNQANGTVLTSIPVTPFTGPATSSNLCSLTTAGFLGLPFMYWRGDMEYMFLIPVSKFHRGSLQLAWSVKPNSSGEITNTRLNQIIDVTASKEWCVSVGYARELPYLESHIVNAYIPTILPIGACLNGFIDVRVMNPLTAPVATANATIFVFARAASNMKFAVPKRLEITTDTENNPQQIPFFSAYTQQGGALGDEPDETQSVVLVPPSGEYKGSEILFGEEIKSVRALVQKPSQIWNAGGLFPSTYIWCDHFPAPPCSSQSGSMGNTPTTGTGTLGAPFFTWAGWYRTIFTGIAGSTRYKVVSLTNSANPIGVAAEPLFQGVVLGAGGLDQSFRQYPSTVSPVWCVSAGEAVEVTVPYYHYMKYTLGRMITMAAIAHDYVPGGRVDTITLPSSGTATNTNVATAVIYVALGPDFRPNMFRFCPRIGINIAPTIGQPYGN